jgi:hypothetical protein
MSDPVTLPPPEEIAERIRACRQELASLRRLERLSRAAQSANLANERRRLLPVSSQDRGKHR